jgi:hypothetical protein
LYDHRPIAPEEQEVQEEVAEDESELLLERVEEEMQALSDDEADDALLRVDDLQGPSKVSQVLIIICSRE